MERVIPPNLLSDIPLLGACSAQALRDIARHGIWMCLPGGGVLFEDKEPADHIWFVLSGSLSAFRVGLDGNQEFVGHIRKGEPVGEFALIANEPHTGFVYATRDSEVLGLHRDDFNRLIVRHPAIMANLARTITLRSRQNRRRNPHAQPRVFAFLSASASLNLAARAQKIADGLVGLGKTVLLVDHRHQNQNSAWFDKAERENDFVLLLCEDTHSPWAQICTRRSDRIWLFGRAEHVPAQFQWPKAFHQGGQLFQQTDLILISTPHTRAPLNTSAWFANVSPTRLLHWRDGITGEAELLVRLIAGTSIGLTLGGGGARAYAHIGVIRALREAGIGFDFVGGTSMGAVVGACLALGWSDRDIERRIWDSFVASSPLDDYHLPVVSMAAGRKVDQRLVQHFGEATIEDMAQPFFCVSSNLSTGRMKVHQTGLLRHALRASIALPGILPPVMSGDDVLADGAILDNLPLGAMRDIHRGHNIAVDVAQQHSLDPDDFRHPLTFTQWVMRYGFKRAPPVAELLMRAATITLPNQNGPVAGELLIVPELENIQLRDWKAFDRAVEAGYLATITALKTAPAFVNIGHSR